MKEIILNLNIHLYNELLNRANNKNKKIEDEIIDILSDNVYLSKYGDLNIIINDNKTKNIVKEEKNTSTDNIIELKHEDDKIGNNDTLIKKIKRVKH